METPWYQVDNVGEIASPGLLIYRDRLIENIRRMIEMANGPARLRPHIKTHKMPAVLELQLRAGITKFKAATIAEATMAAQAGAADVLFAYQPVGPNIVRLADLVGRFPQTRFATIADDPEVLQSLSQTFAAARLILPVYLDLDCGMHRSGISPGPAAMEIYRQLTILPALSPAGLHAYDGHLHQANVIERREAWQKSFALVSVFRDQLIAQGLSVPNLVAGGTPTFPFYADETDVECSPGTCVFWDAGYATKLPDMKFIPAAAVLTRVVSKPSSDRLCLDLGHKAVAAENPPPRVYFPDLPDATAVGHSEEHLVVETKSGDRWKVGAELYGIPWHICPTVALHARATVVADRRAIAQWSIVARDR
jgi:D-serine deaminase-like pyridoxal phosphate-dependent protein